MAELNVELPDFLHWQDGEVRLVGHRIGLVTVARLYREGYSAERLALEFPTLSMVQIHKVIAFYWEHRPEVEKYVDQFDAELAEIERQNPTQVTLQILRERLAKLHDAEMANTFKQ